MRRAEVLIDFPDLLGQERGVRQDTRMTPEIGHLAAPPGPFGGAPAPGAGVSLRALAHAYGELRTIERIDLELEAHGVVGLVGPSGCGKSTLLELICGLREPGAGTLEVGGAADAAGRLSRCAYMPQRDLLLPWYSALDNAALALRNRGLGKAEARRRAAALFERFGLAGFEATPPAELSGGMRQRVAFLRTLVAGKPVLALDEPFASLDAITRAEMQEWLAAALRADPRTVVLVSHDVEEALYLSDRVAVLSARPARVVAELRAPDPRAADRDAAVTDPAFVAVREEAMRALREGSR
jgi:ABC-type nitrate/sulfonate/bicarbonate transport system ATPase subunit